MGLFQINKLDKTLKITINRAKLEENKLNDASGFK